eukprot:354688_1
MPKVLSQLNKTLRNLSKESMANTSVVDHDLLTISIPMSCALILEQSCDHSEIIAALQQLECIPMSVDTLYSTKIGCIVKKLTKRADLPSNIHAFAQKLVNDWKAITTASWGKEPSQWEPLSVDTSTSSSSLQNPNRNRKRSYSSIFKLMINNTNHTNTNTRDTNNKRQRLNHNHKRRKPHVQIEKHSYLSET